MNTANVEEMSQPMTENSNAENVPFWRAGKDNTEDMRVYQWLTDMCTMEKRLDAMLQLSKRRAEIDNLGFILWHSFGVVSALLQEVTSIFSDVVSGKLTSSQSNRASAALALVQVMASNAEVKLHLLHSEIMMYLVPLLKSACQTRPFEYLRLSVLGVFGTILKNPCDESVSFLLKAELLPTLLRILESGSELCKAVGAYVLYRILSHALGLEYICNSPDRFTHVAFTLGKVVDQLTLEPSIRILKHIIRCYERLADNPSARLVLMEHLPEQLRNSTFCDCLQEDKSSRDSLMELIKKVGFGKLTPDTDTAEDNPSQE